MGYIAGNEGSAGEVKELQADEHQISERRRKLARLKVLRLREQRLKLDRRDLEKDPEYVPEPSEDSVEET